MTADVGLHGKELMPVALMFFIATFWACLLVMLVYNAYDLHLRLDVSSMLLGTTPPVCYPIIWASWFESLLCLTHWPLSTTTMNALRAPPTTSRSLNASVAAVRGLNILSGHPHRVQLEMTLLSKSLQNVYPKKSSAGWSPTVQYNNSNTSCCSVPFLPW